jgi:hypothetical protein
MRLQFRIMLAGLAAIVAGATVVSAATGGAASSAPSPHITVYKSPTCGCCQDWVEHIEEHGFTVTVHDTSTLTEVKARRNVPQALQSCHTAEVGGYVVEGHVPADLVQRLLKERPAVVGLAVPGMPMGSPGMEGPRKDPYDVVTFDRRGQTAVYAKR